MSTVLLIATLSTKTEESGYLAQHLSEHGVEVVTLDASLNTEGTVLDGPGKTAAMDRAVSQTKASLAKAMNAGVHAVIGLGGGTGSEIILRAMRDLPITFPKVLVTTMPFDPRHTVADNSIVLVPSLADICGLNATLREVLENAAAMTAGLCQTRRQADACVQNPSIGITALGATEGAISRLVSGFRKQGHESTVFHANGFGGAAFARFANRGAFHAIIDLTPHELTRIHIAGAHVDMPDRFSTSQDVPRIVLPGALNFLGLGEKSLVPARFLERPHYEHSGLFTHSKLSQDEMELVATKLADSLNLAVGSTALIVPMGGFSHQDRPGGAIEDMELRKTFLKIARAKLNSDVQLIEMPAHISEPSVTEKILSTLDGMLPPKGKPNE